MISARVKGANQLGDLAKRLKAEGEAGKGFRKELLREIRTEGKPTVTAAKKAVTGLPTKPPEDRGLRSGIAKGVRLRTRLTGKRIGVRVSVARFEGTNLPRRLNKGSWRHPVYGNKNVYVTQTIKPGWFDDTMRATGPKFRLKVRQAIRHTADRIARG